MGLILTFACCMTAHAQAPAIIVQPNTVVACPTEISGADVTYTVTATGADLAYQWLKDGVNIGGATASSYTVTGVTRSSVGAYSVLVSNISGSVISDMTFLGNLWTGAVSDAYEDPLNWSCNFVPSVSDNASFPAGASNYPVITGSHACQDVNIVSGASVLVSATGVLDIARNINNEGTLDVAAGSVRMVGNVTQSIPENAFSTNTVNNLDIINPSGVVLDGPLNIRGVLSPQQGNFATGGHLVFKSDVIATAMLGAVTGSISGEVTVEQYIPAKRAFRFMTSSVTSAGSIYENWQESGSDAPGWGTDITGTGGAVNGFDVSGSNSPSMFTHAHNNSTTGTWNAVTNTNILTLNAGQPFRIMVRGDRTINQALNNATPTVTLMRAKGVLSTGDIVVNGLNTAVGGFTILGNPYQARLNLYDALGLSSDGLNKQFYYVWDPTRNTRGAYVTVDLENNLNNVSGSTANRLVPAGQAFYVRSETDSPSLTFKEAHKDVQDVATQPIFRSSASVEVIPMMRFTLFESGALASNGSPADGFLAVFDPSYSNDVDDFDAPKMTNLDENMGLMNSGYLLSYESRNLPAVTDVMPISITQYRNTNYTYKVDVSGIQGVDAYLVDKFTNTETLLQNGIQTTIPFQVNATVPGSVVANRFDVVFRTSLSTEETAFAKSVRVYPNPIVENQFYVALTENIEGNVNLKMINLLGQEVYASVLQSGQKEVKVQPLSALQSGIYLVKISNGSQTTTKKVVVK